MKTFKNPPRKEWPELTKRPALELEYLESTVRNILNRVKTSGDDALKELSLQFDKVKLDSITVSEEEIGEVKSKLSKQLTDAIDVAASNIKKFHEVQKREVTPIETLPGVTCWRRGVPIEKVGIYIPGGTAPLFSTVLMLAIPAKLAGCKEVVLCSPPDQNGKLHPAIIFAATVAGISKMFKCGGAQAIAAMAYGTQSIPAVNKIFGPGNQYVTKAKQLVNQEGIAIDLPAGPSEVLIIADANANPAYVASDLLAQAEHGTDSQVVLTTTDGNLVTKISNEVEMQLADLPRKALATESLSNSLAISFSSESELLDFVNEYAPEHLIINTANADDLAAKISNAGSVFIGQWSPESAGDYASGTNHTLPTNGFAKAYGGVSLESFIKYITYQKLTPEGLKKLGPHVEVLAEAENLAGHKNSISIRLKDL